MTATAKQRNEPARIGIPLTADIDAKLRHRLGIRARLALLPLAAIGPFAPLGLRAGQVAGEVGSEEIFGLGQAGPVGTDERSRDRLRVAPGQKGSGHGQILVGRGFRQGRVAQEALLVLRPNGIRRRRVHPLGRDPG